jgi:hypothetical protein
LFIGIFTMSMPNLTFLPRVSYYCHVAHGDKRDAYRILVRKPEENRPLGRSRNEWVDNIKMDLREIGWGGIDRIDVAQDRDQ